MIDDETNAEFLSGRVTKISEILSGLNGKKRIEHLRAFILISKIVMEVTESKKVTRKDRSEFLDAIKNPLVSIAVVSFNPSVDTENL